jgi:hypothetical protein
MEAAFTPAPWAVRSPMPELAQTADVAAESPAPQRATAGAQSAHSLAFAGALRSPPTPILARIADVSGMLLALQRAAGNQAVARLVGEARAQPLLARFESPEHVAFGDRHLQDLDTFIDTPEGTDWVKRYKLEGSVAGVHSDPTLSGRKIKVGSMELSPGEVIALVGDFYETPGALKQANPAEVRELLNTIRQEGAGVLKGGKANELYQKITVKYRGEKGSFLELAKRNKPHFAPGNREEWAKLHNEALKLARESRTDKALLEDALLYDAGGGHFLTDAFASGHLFDKSKLEVAILRHLRSKPARANNPEMQMYYGIVEAKDSMHLLVLKNIHDRLNAEGFEVSNKKGMKWKTFGDDHLRSAKETQHIAALAVAVSRRQIMDVNKGGAEADPNEVLDLLPDDDSVARATTAAEAMIPQAAADVDALMYRQRGAAGAALPPVIGPLVESNLGAIGSPSRERDIEAARQRARDTGMGQPVPQFNILNW